METVESREESRQMNQLLLLSSDIQLVIADPINSLLLEKKKKFCLKSSRTPSSEVILEGRKLLQKQRAFSFPSYRHPTVFVVSHLQSKLQL